MAGSAISDTTTEKTSSLLILKMVTIFCVSAPMYNSYSWQDELGKRCAVP